MKKNLIEVREENEGAFTLIELLVVILIIGILAAIAIPVFLNQRKAAVDAAVKSDVKNAATQVETWAVAHPSTVVSGGTITSTAKPADPWGDIKVSNGTTLTITGDSKSAGGYTIKGTNTGGSESVAGINYSSAAGGLTATPTPSPVG